jgi:toxin ParE1/3/4
VKVLWSAASLSHLQQVVDYLQGETSGGATTIRRRILETKRRIGQMPYSGKVGRIDGTREAVVPRTPFILVYRVSEKTLDILGIWHAARLWPESFEPPTSS